MSGMGGVAVQADLQPDTTITIRTTAGLAGLVVVSMGDHTGRVDLYGSATELRRLAHTILAALPEEEGEGS